MKVSHAAHTEIAALLRAAGYDHVFMEGGMIDMSGIGLTAAAAQAEPLGFVHVSAELLLREKGGWVHLNGEKIAGTYDLPVCATPQAHTAEPGQTKPKCVIYLETDPIDVAQFYRAKGFQHLPPTPTMTGAEIRACGWKKNNYQMYIDVTPMVPVGDTGAIALVDGMKFFCIPPATW